MPRRLTNLILAAAVAVLGVSGVLGWILPDVAADPFYVLHRAGGLALLIALLWKVPIVRGSLRRRLPRRMGGSLAVSSAAAIALTATIGLGFAWTLGLVSFDRPWSYSLLNLHVFIGVALVPLLIQHWVDRSELVGVRAAVLARRNAIRLVALGVAGLALVPVLDIVADKRRPSGSKAARSFSGNDFPVTIWNFDAVPAIDAAEWTVGLSGAVAAPTRLALADLARFPQRERTATLDCTSGWWSEQVWRGAGVLDVMRASGLDSGARDAQVVSVTGHRWSFPLADLEEALLATHVGGQVLQPGHGYPVRLVVPGRRGFQWIKWVDRIEVT
ncbi:MAG: molybdopterin-dependent oxidoreductase [Chloroflexota bacterium]|nr:molybdopterin-dependent oxidoreductase [Chloroflexota bacterium]